jgi:hypothetical protein
VCIQADTGTSTAAGGFGSGRLSRAIADAIELLQELNRVSEKPVHLSKEA